MQRAVMLFLGQMKCHGERREYTTHLENEPFARKLASSSVHKVAKNGNVIIKKIETLFKTMASSGVTLAPNLWPDIACAQMLGKRGIGNGQNMSCNSVSRFLAFHRPKLPAMRHSFQVYLGPQAFALLAALPHRCCH